MFLVFIIEKAAVEGGKTEGVEEKKKEKGWGGVGGKMKEKGEAGREKRWRR